MPAYLMHVFGRLVEVISDVRRENALNDETRV